MTKAIRFKFPGNINWGSDEDKQAEIIRNYIESELEIGNGTFLGVADRDEIPVDCPMAAGGYSPREINIEIITNLPVHILDDEFEIRKKLITKLEDEKISFFKFQNCGNRQHITATLT